MDENQEKKGKGQLITNRNAAGEIISYRFRCCVGRDENRKQIWRYKTIKRPIGLTPKKEEKAVKRQFDEWEQNVRNEYEQDKKKVSQEKKTVKDKITLLEFIDNEWIPKHVRDGEHSPDSIQFYENTAKYIKAYFKEKNSSLKLKEIKKENIVDFITYMRNTARTQKGKPYSKTTVQHCFSTLRNILNFAVYIEYLPENPCNRIEEKKRPKREQHEIDFLDEEQSVAFLTALESEKEQDYWKKKAGGHMFWRCLCNMILLTGLRRGELVGLQWRDLDERKLMLHVCRNVTIDTSHKSAKDPAEKIHIGTLKNKESRTVPVSKYLYDQLKEFEKVQKGKYGDDLQPDSFIFCRAEDPQLPLYPTEPTRMMRKFIERHGLPDVSPHDLRHSAASLAIEAGANIKEIQALLGHKDPSTTLRFYAGLSEKSRRSTVDKIENLLRPPKKPEETAEGENSLQDDQHDDQSQGEEPRQDTP